MLNEFRDFWCAMSIFGLLLVGGELALDGCVDALMSNWSMAVTRWTGALVLSAILLRMHRESKEKS